MRCVLIIMMSLLVATSPASAWCRVAHVVDGDTLRLVCEDGTHRVRVLGFDTPELYHPRCPAERKAAVRASEEMRRLVTQGPVTEFRITGQDRFGRDLAWVAIAGRDVTAVMLGSGLARPYGGGMHPDWCEGE